MYYSNVIERKKKIKKKRKKHFQGNTHQVHGRSTFTSKHNFLTRIHTFMLIMRKEKNEQPW